MIRHCRCEDNPIFKHIGVVCESWKQSVGRSDWHLLSCPPKEFSFFVTAVCIEKYFFIIKHWTFWQSLLSVFWNQSAASLAVFVLFPFLDTSNHTQLLDGKIPVTVPKCDSSQQWSMFVGETAGCALYSCYSVWPSTWMKNIVIHTLVWVQVYGLQLLLWQLEDRLLHQLSFQVYFWARLNTVQFMW